MTRKRGLRSFSDEELLHEVARRHADKMYRDGMTMTDIELAAEKLKSNSGDPCVRAMLSRMKPEKPTGKACPRCGKRIPVKARDRERTVRSLSGPVTFKRNYHWCERCKYGFYPVDRLLGLPEEGELTSEMEKRVLDFAVNDVYGECAARWNLHYAEPISENLLRRVIARVGAQCEEADQAVLHQELKPVETAAEVLVVETDGSLLPIRGAEPWKEAKVGVLFRHNCETNEPVPESARYVAVVNGLGEFAPVLEEALHAERIDEVPLVAWIGDGAPCNWTLADQLAPDAVQILDWHHAVEHAVACGKVLLDEDSPWLPLWQRRAEQLLAQGPEAIIAELMSCVPEVEKRKRDRADALRSLDDLVRYYRNNERRDGRKCAPPRPADPDETRRPALDDAQCSADGPSARRIPNGRAEALLRRHPTSVLGLAQRRRSRARQSQGLPLCPGWPARYKSLCEGGLKLIVRPRVKPTTVLGHMRTVRHSGFVLLALSLGCAAHNAPAPAGRCMQTLRAVLHRADAIRIRRITGPLAMHDTSFRVPDGKRDGWPRSFAKMRRES